MYFNNLHILWYVLISALGLIIGKFISYVNEMFNKNEKIFTKDFFKKIIKNYNFNYCIMISIAGLYVFLLYKYGFKKDIFKNLDLLKFLILIPMLISAFFVDLKNRIIPNRLNMTIFEIGICLTVLYAYNNINIAKDMLLGFVTGGGIFLAITLLGGVIAGKEAMGLGDVKLMSAIGIFFGASSIAQISLLAFFIAAPISIIILVTRMFIVKKKDEYIPFGPFLVISAIICIFLPTNIVWSTFINFCNIVSDFLINIIL